MILIDKHDLGKQLFDLFGQAQFPMHPINQAKMNEQKIYELITYLERVREVDVFDIDFVIDNWNDFESKFNTEIGFSKYIQSQGYQLIKTK